MRRCLTVSLTLSLTAAVSLLVTADVVAQRPSSLGNLPSKVGGVAVAEILERIGAKMEHGVTRDQLADYARHFDLVDLDGDGRHSKVEYIEKGTYLSPMARRGIFAAADNDRDGSVTKAEYTLNRIITDEAKAIVQAMDDGKDRAVQATEFTKHAGAILKDAKLAGQMFAALDTDGDKLIRVPEYLRVWGRWARAGRKPAEQRIAAQEVKLREASKGPREKTAEGNPRN